MKQRLNVQEQNAETKQMIVECDRRFRNAPDEYSWLKKILVEKCLHENCGILARIAFYAPCYCCGLWLDQSGRFYSFDIELEGYDSRQVVGIEEWKDCTDDVEVSNHKKGIGKTYGFLAIEVLRERISSLNE